MTDWPRIRALKDDDIQVTPEHPAFDPRHAINVVVRDGLKVLARKKSVALRIDADVLDWFQAQGPGYQTRMNAVLKAFKEVSVAQSARRVMR